MSDEPLDVQSALAPGQQFKERLIVIDNKRAGSIRERCRGAIKPDFRW